MVRHKRYFKHRLATSHCNLGITISLSIAENTRKEYLHHDHELSVTTFRRTTCPNHILIKVFPHMFDNGVLEHTKLLSKRFRNCICWRHYVYGTQWRVSVHSGLSERNCYNGQQKKLYAQCKRFELTTRAALKDTNSTRCTMWEIILMLICEMITLAPGETSECKWR